jgi:hypothetical protein
MEGLFKFFFFLAVLIFCCVVVGIFLVFLKIILLFTPIINIMGLQIIQGLS